MAGGPAVALVELAPVGRGAIGDGGGGAVDPQRRGGKDRRLGRAGAGRLAGLQGAHLGLVARRHDGGNVVGQDQHRALTDRPGNVGDVEAGSPAAQRLEALADFCGCRRTGLADGCGHGHSPRTGVGGPREALLAPCRGTPGTAAVDS